MTSYNEIFRQNRIEGYHQRIFSALTHSKATAEALNVTCEPKPFAYNCHLEQP